MTKDKSEIFINIIILFEKHQHLKVFENDMNNKLHKRVLLDKQIIVQLVRT
jgi:hypothetical protein